MVRRQEDNAILQIQTLASNRHRLMYLCTINHTIYKVLSNNCEGSFLFANNWVDVLISPDCNLSRQRNRLRCHLRSLSITNASLSLRWNNQTTIQAVKISPVTFTDQISRIFCPFRVVNNCPTDTEVDQRINGKYYTCLICVDILALLSSIRSRIWPREHAANPFSLSFNAAVLGARRYFSR